MSEHDRHPFVEKDDFAIASENEIKSTTVVSIINQDEQIVVFAFRILWQGNDNPSWSHMNPPLGQNCTAQLNDCVLLGNYRTVGSVTTELANKRLQIAYRRQNGPLKGASAVIADTANAYTYIARGSLGG